MFESFGANNLFAAAKSMLLSEFILCCAFSEHVTLATINQRKVLAVARHFAFLIKKNLSKPPLYPPLALENNKRERLKELENNILIN